MNYHTFHIILTSGTKLSVVATSIESARADIAEAFEGAEILTYSMEE